MFQDKSILVQAHWPRTPKGHCVSGLASWFQRAIGAVKTSHDEMSVNDDLCLWNTFISLVNLFQNNAKYRFLLDATVKTIFHKSMTVLAGEVKHFDPI